MSDSETLSQILAELKKINGVLQDFKSSYEDEHELLMNKLSVIESISDKARNALISIEKKS